MPDDPNFSTPEAPTPETPTPPAGFDATESIILIPQASGRLAAFSRDYQFMELLDHAPTLDEIFALSRRFRQSRREATVAAAARFYGEPDAKTMARDIRRANTPPREPRPARASLAVELDL